MSLRRRLVPALAALAAAAVAVPLVAAPSSAAPANRSSPALYLALGDSVAAGVGAPAGQGYVDLLGARLSEALDCNTGNAVACRRTENISVSGATTQTLIDAQLPAAVKRLTQRNQNASTADDIRLVTVTIGGNDVVGPVVAACGGDPQSWQCATAVQTVLGGLAQRYAAILHELRQAAGPDTTIAVMTYYNAFVGSCYMLEVFPALHVLAPALLDGSEYTLNGVIRATADQVDALVVDTAADITADELVGGSDCLHPNSAGHAAIADAFYTAVAPELS